MTQGVLQHGDGQLLQAACCAGRGRGDNDVVSRNLRGALLEYLGESGLSVGPGQPDRPEEQQRGVGGIALGFKVREAGSRLSGARLRTTRRSDERGRMRRTSWGSSLRSMSATSARAFCASASASTELSTRVARAPILSILLATWGNNLVTRACQ